MKIRNDCLKENTLQVEIDNQCQDISSITNLDCCDNILDRIDDLSDQSKECCDTLSTKLDVISNKLKPIIKIVYKPISVIKYIEIRTIKYVVTKDPKPDDIIIIGPSDIPPGPIPGWILDPSGKFYYKIVRGIKYIKINDKIWREEDYLKEIAPPEFTTRQLNSGEQFKKEKISYEKKNNIKYSNHHKSNLYDGMNMKSEVKKWEQLPSGGWSPRSI
jgi:hypothetical protein